jgi:hypothetical protein
MFLSSSNTRHTQHPRQRSDQAADRSTLARALDIDIAMSDSTPDVNDVDVDHMPHERTKRSIDTSSLSSS